jgi:hypothetical protein
MRSWLALSPFGLGFTRPLGSSKPEPPGSCRQTLRVSSLALARHLSGLPRIALPRAERLADSALGARLLDSVFGPSAYPSGDALFFAENFSLRLKSFAVLFRSSALRVWLPSRRIQPSLPSGLFFQSPRSWASLFRALFRTYNADQVSQICSALTLSCQTYLPGSGASTVFVRKPSCTPCLRIMFQTRTGPKPS